MIDELYETIGGSQVINAAIECFYQRVVADEQLRPFFESTNMAHLQEGQSMFLSMLLGGRVVYTGRDIGEAHNELRTLGLNETHFNRFLDHFRAALDEVGVQPQTAEKVLTLLEAKRGTVIHSAKAQSQG